MKQTTNETCVEYPSRIFGEPFALNGESVSQTTSKETTRSQKNRSAVWTTLKEVFRAIGHHWVTTSAARAHGWSD
jgi:hypothetical protein